MLLTDDDKNFFHITQMNQLYIISKKLNQSLKYMKFTHENKNDVSKDPYLIFALFNSILSEREANEYWKRWSKYLRAEPFSILILISNVPTPHLVVSILYVIQWIEHTFPTSFSITP